MQSVAINVGANTNEPGVRGPIDADGRFEYVPIPESEPIRSGVNVPTYGDLTAPRSTTSPSGFRAAMPEPTRTAS